MKRRVALRVLLGVIVLTAPVTIEQVVEARIKTPPPVQEGGSPPPDGPIDPDGCTPADFWPFC